VQERTRANCCGALGVIARYPLRPNAVLSRYLAAGNSGGNFGPWICKLLNPGLGDLYFELTPIGLASGCAKGTQGGPDILRASPCGFRL
jgi:hypothetical protein